MSAHLAQLAVLLFAGYAALGCLFAVAFVVRGVARVDPVAAAAPIGFRLVILPGVAALWPWLLLRWVHAPVPVVPGAAPDTHP